MFKKYSVFIGIIIALLLLVIATRYYPGGSQHNKNSIGYDWKNNYLSNLFGEKAVNGAPNTARPWSAARNVIPLGELCFVLYRFFKKDSTEKRR